jgi:chromosome partitioning protein
VNGLRAYHLFQEQLPTYRPLAGKDGIDVVYSLGGDVDVMSIEQDPRKLEVVKSVLANTDFVDEYDVVVIDTAPGMGFVTTAALCMADYTFVPVELAAFATDGVRQLLTSFKRLSISTGQSLKPTGFICNKLNSRAAAHKDSLDELRKEIGPYIMRNQVNNRVAVDTAVMQGIPVWELKSGAERLAGEEMWNLMEEIAVQSGLEVKTMAEIRSAEKIAKRKQAQQAKESTGVV